MTHPVTGFLEGLMGGVQAGTQFRWARDDRRQAQAEHAGDQEYEKARRLREDVAFELQQRVGNAQLDNLQGPHYTEVSPGATLHDPTGRGQDYTAPGGQAERPLVQDWQKEGFQDQPAWMKYHEQISRAGGSGGERGQVTPAAIFQAKTRLMEPHWGPDATGALKMLPGVSPEEADRIVGQATGTYRAPSPPDRPPNPFSGRGMGAGTRGTAPRPPMPQGGGSAGGPPSRTTNAPAARWEELVRSGMNKQAAAAQVKQEFGLP